MDFCDDSRITFVFGLAGNAALDRSIDIASARRIVDAEIGPEPESTDMTR
jgi:hypothetical protein